VIKTYYLLTKPGIILGNLITTGAGFALASRGELDWRLFLPMLIGLGCVIASACVFNNYIDREIDRKMERTKTRALARGAISGQKAILFAIVLGLAGVAVLGLYTNLLATAIAALGFFVYVILYSFWKTKKTYATFVGSISGALPPVIGYTAVSNRLDAGAALLFLILVLWQMPHFFSIAIFRFDDYSAANIPVLPIEKGTFTAKIHMALYIFAFIVATVLMSAFGYTGTAYLFVAAPLGLAWLWLSLKGFKAKSDPVWARQMFRLSLVVVTALSIMISIDYVKELL
jgi:protoheme IX farnesyltransferase